MTFAIKPYFIKDGTKECHRGNFILQNSDFHVINVFTRKVPFEITRVLVITKCVLQLLTFFGINASNLLQ